MREYDPSRYASHRFVAEGGATSVATWNAYWGWSERWCREAHAQGWAIFEAGVSFQVQKLDAPDERREPDGARPPEWDNDAIAWGFVYHGTSDLHRETREFLKQYAPNEWALIEEACNGKTDTEATLCAGAGATDGE